MGTDRFHSKTLNNDQLHKSEIVRTLFTQLYDYLDSEVSDGREKSLCFTKLEEACMWAVKAIAEEKEKEDK